MITILVLTLTSQERKSSGFPPPLTLSLTLQVSESSDIPQAKRKKHIASETSTVRDMDETYTYAVREKRLVNQGGYVVMGSSFPPLKKREGKTHLQHSRA
jgi:hypothetical protein